jgi:hypothetical protein
MPESDEFFDREENGLEIIKKEAGVMKTRGLIVVLISYLFLFPSFAQSQPDRILEKLFEPKIHSGDLRVLQLEMNPDPVREGQWVSFQAAVSNRSHHSARVSLFVKDRDEVVTGVHDVLLKVGNNRIFFPQTQYRFSRNEYCFTVEVDIERTRRPIDVVKEFCARRTYQGWSMNAPRVGPLFVEDLDITPDPVSPGQEIRFKARLRNDGSPVRADIRIQDRDQLVARLNDVILHRGHSEFLFPYTRYQFQRFDHCFTVVVDVERTPYRVDAAREFCARPYGWTLRP